MPKRALIVGINRYDNFNPLNSCVSDAEEMTKILSCNDDESPNFECVLITSPGPASVRKAFLRRRWRELFHDFKDDILFYFAGHGTPTEVGGYLVTQDGEPDDPGLPMAEVVDMANNSSARSVLLVLDCCFSGWAGNPAGLQNGNLEGRALLRQGVTILAASRPTEVSAENGDHGVFTNLVIDALRGGAADLRGRVSAASIYAYVEAALGAWTQRPLYKSYSASLNPVRLCQPKVPDSLLRELPVYFPRPGYRYQLDPTYEETSGTSSLEHVEVFRKFKRLQVGGLLRPERGDHLYWAATGSERVVLTELGRFYLQLVNNKRI